MKNLNNCEIRVSYKYILIVFSFIVLFAMAKVVTPNRYGDGFEYLYMQQAFQNHFTPDVNTIDISDMQELSNANNTPPPSDSYSGFFKSYSGKMYSYHFWLYPLVCSFFAEILNLFNLNTFRSMQITNAIFFIISLWVSYFYLNFDNRKKIILISLLSINPVLWYLTWTHPEVFSYSLIVISLCFYSNKKYKLAMLFSALAATQNPPLLILNMFYLYEYFKLNYKRKNFKDWCLALLSCLPIVLPNIFYLINFGTLNLITRTGGAGIEYLSFQKLYDQFFDLNIGLLPYIPLITFLFFYIIIKTIIEKKYMLLLWPSMIILMMLLSEQTGNWNHGCAGIIRYNIWILPILLFYILLEVDINKIFFKNFLFISIIVQSTIIYNFGLFNCNIFYTEFTPMAKFVLNNFPSLYSPDPEIFAERTTHEDGYKVYNGAIYLDGDDVRKAFINYYQLEKFTDEFKIIDENYYNQLLLKLSGNKSKMHYINFIRGSIVKK